MAKEQPYQWYVDAYKEFERKQAEEKIKIDKVNRKENIRYYLMAAITILSLVVAIMQTCISYKQSQPKIQTASKSNKTLHLSSKDSSVVYRK